jgi:hypothetical protein
MRYLVRHNVKELVLKNFTGLPADQLLQRMIELSLYAERACDPQRTARLQQTRDIKGHAEGNKEPQSRATFRDDSQHQVNGINCSSRRHQNVSSLI